MALQMRRRGLAVNTKFIAIFVAVFALLAQPIGGVFTSAIALATPSLAQRVADANPGDTIDVTSDETISNEIVVNKPLTIKSSNGSTLTAAVPMNGILGLQSDNITVEGLTFKGNYTIGDGQVVRGLEVSSHSGLVIKDNKFLNLRQPAYINDNTTATITNNYTDETKGWVVLSNTNLTFSGNTWGTNVLDIAIIAGGTNNYDDASVVSMSDANNDAVVENQFGGVKRLSDSYVAPTPNGNSGDEGGKWNPYTVIQNGVERVVNGGTVHVKNGTYTQSTTVNKTLTLAAESQSARVVGGPTYDNPAFNVTAPNVAINGFTIGHDTNMLSIVGVQLGSSTGAKITNNVIEHNQRGISLAGAGNVTIMGNTVRDNNANQENNAGIWGDAVNGITISNSTFSGASNTSINLAGSQNLTLNDNTFTSGGNAAVLWGDSNVTLTNNNIAGLSSTGFFITGVNGLTASGNTLGAPTASGKSGFGFSSAGGTSSNATLNLNKVTGYTNGVNALSGTVTDQVLATGNWWGDASGPKDTNAADGSKPASNAGTGVAVNGNVKYAGWCLTAVCDSFHEVILSAPTGLTPANGTTTNDPGFNMGWNTVAGATRYEYRTANVLADSNTLGPIIYSDNSSSSNYSIAGGKVTRGNNGTPDNDYYWQVRAGDNDGNWSPWSSISKVTVDTVAPATPTHVSPADNAVINTNDFWFDWNDVQGAVGYEIQNSQSPAVDSNGSFANVQWTGDYQRIQPTESKARSVGANGTWYWQVRAVDAAGNKSAWTTPWKITIDMQAPAAPVLSVKASDGTVLTSGAYSNKYSITANWTETSTDAVKYLYKYWNAIPGNPYDAAHPYVVETTSMSQSGVFNQGEGIHYMQIFAIDAAGNVSAGSNVFEVKYDATKPTVLGERVDTNTFKVTATDAALNKVVANLYKVGQSGVFKPYQTSASNTLTIDLSTLAAGDYYIKYNATDKAGNLSTTNTYEFTIAAPVTNTNTTNTGNSSTGNTGQVAGASTTSTSSSTPPQSSTQSSTPGQGGGVAPSGASAQQSTASVDAAGVSSTTDPEVLSAQTADNTQGSTKNATDPTGYVADASTQNAAGFAWYWWLVIAAAVIAALWAIIAAVRRRSSQAQ